MAASVQKARNDRLSVDALCRDYDPILKVLKVLVLIYKNNGNNDLVKPSVKQKRGELLIDHILAIPEEDSDDEQEEEEEILQESFK